MCGLFLFVRLGKLYFSVLYSECLPNEAPPTFRGQLVKYIYKITVGVQRLNNPIKLLRVPFHVLAFTGNF